MKSYVQLLAVSAALQGSAKAFVASPVIEGRQSGGAAVDFSTSIGQPQHLASGFIYGIPDSNQIPRHWYTGMGFKNGKGGGAQLSAGGWVTGMSGYQGRFQSTLDNYKTCRQVGADFSIYVHDLWGTDHATSSTKWPGDNGDWSDYTKFVNQVMADVAANMDPQYVTWDIWNEADGGYFWKRTQAQWIQLWTNTYQQIRANSKLNAMKISGPSHANTPSSGDSWWTTWLSTVKSSNTIPDVWTYHLEAGPGDSACDPAVTNGTLAQMLSSQGLPQRQVFINEYATQDEMLPSGYVWWISRLERYDMLGMLGNWLGGTTLHDLFAQLLTKPGNDYNTYNATDYAAAPGYPVFQYYNQEMTGQRVKTAGSSDKQFDVYATKNGNKGRIIAGSRIQTGTWSITVSGLSGSSVSVTQKAFNGSSISQSVTNQPAVKETKTYTVSDGAITIVVNQQDTSTAWAFELTV